MNDEVGDNRVRDLAICFIHNASAMKDAATAKTTATMMSAMNKAITFFFFSSFIDCTSKESV